MTALKTVEYAFPVLASLTDNTLTALTQITVYLPEDTKTFKSVLFRMTADDIITVTGGTIASRRLDCSVNGAAATSATNNLAWTNSGENISVTYTADFTAHFASNWGTATSRTLDCSVLVDQTTGTTLGLVNVCVTVIITYEFDEASTTHVKTVWIPLNAPVGALAASKPGSATDTIPKLDDYCPEASKTFRQINIVAQGNMAVAASTTDSTLSIEIDSAGPQTTGNHEAALASDRFFRHVFPAQSFTTSATHSFYIWGSVARYNHLQVWMVVTYEYNPSSTTRVLCNAQIHMGGGQEIGGTTSGDYIVAEGTLWIPEPGTISDTKLASFMFWGQSGPIGGLNMRLGSGSFVAYTDAANVCAGGQAAMIRNDSAYTLARGKNTMYTMAYRTDATDFGESFSGYLLACYTADKPSTGAWACNRIIHQNLRAFATATSLVGSAVVASALASWGTNYFVNTVQAMVEIIPDAGNTIGYRILSYNLAGSDLYAKRAAIDAGISKSDAETGLYVSFLDASRPLYRWAADPDIYRENPTAGSTKWSLDIGTANHFAFAMVATIHNVTFTATGTLSGAAAGSVTYALHRASDGCKVAETTRSGSGAMSLTWYDNTADVFMVAVDSAGRAGRSRAGKAGTDALNIVLGIPEAVAA